MKHAYSTGEVAKVLKLPTRRIRAYARAGRLGGPGRGRLSFDFRDLSVLRAAKRLESAGVSHARVRRILIQLRAVSEHPLSQLTLSCDGVRVVASDGGQRWDPETGQYELFTSTRSGTPVGPAITSGAPSVRFYPADLLAADDPSTASGWFDLALSLEDLDPQRAYEAYLRALACDPEHVEALINVGRLCSAAGEYGRAAAYFRQAIRVAPTQPVAHFNLGVTLHDLGDVHGAIVAYRSALSHDRSFADAHYNLATLLGELGDRAGADHHMAAYQRTSRQPD